MKPRAVLRAQAAPALHPLLKEAISKSTKISPAKLAIYVPKTLSFLVKQMLAGRETTYTDVSIAIGAGNAQNANWGFASIARVLRLLESEPKFSRESFPDPTSIVRKKNSRMGGRGAFSSQMDMTTKNKTEQLRWLEQRRQHAFRFGKKWLQVLAYLEIQPMKDLSTSETILDKFAADFSSQTAEGPEHLAIKKWVADNPGRFLNENSGIVIHVEEEHLFWSLDRLDVFIETAREVIGVEVKPSTASPYEIRKGLYQVMKYRSLLDADLLVQGSGLAHRCLLVLGGRLPIELREIVRRLEVTVLEDFLHVVRPA